MELADAIQSEQHVKKELARRMGELQEELHNTREQVRSHTLTISLHDKHNWRSADEFLCWGICRFLPLFSVSLCYLVQSYIFPILVCFMHSTALAQAIYDNSMQKEIK